MAEHLVYARDHIEKVDVTDQLVAEMGADQKTLDLIKQMREDRKQR